VSQRNFSGRRLLALAAMPIALAAVLVAAEMRRWHDARILDRMVEAQDFTATVDFLKHHYDFNRRSGRLALQRFALTVMRQGLKQHDPFERCYCATGLAVYGDWSGMPAITAALGSHDPMLRRAAIEGLADAHNARALELLRTVYRNGNAVQRVMVAQALAARRDHGALPMLLEATRSDVPEVRLWSVWGLGRQGDRHVLAYLHDLQGGERDERVGAALARSELRLGDRSLGNVAILETALYMEDTTLASDAALALADAHDQIALTQLRAAVSNPQLDLRVRLAAAVALTRYGDRDGLTLMNYVVTEPYERGFLSPMFNDLGLEAGRSVLLAAIASQDIVIRLAAVEAFGRIGGSAEIGILTQALHQASDPFLVAQIAWSLGRIGAPESVAPLLDLAADPNATVRDTAADALARLAFARQPGLF